MDEEGAIYAAVEECIKIAQDLPQTSGVFRITNGHARKAELCSKALEICKILQQHRTTPTQQVVKVVQDFQELLGKVSLADGRNYAVQMSKVSLRFLYSVEEAVVKAQGQLARPEILDHLPLSSWQLLTKEWDNGMSQLKDSIKELSVGPDNSPQLGTSPITSAGNEIDAEIGKGTIYGKIIALLKGVKTLMRKVRTKCLQPLIEPVETAEGIAWLDDLLDAVGPLMRATEEMTVASIPPEHPMQMANWASEVAILGQRLCDIAKAYPGNPPMLSYGKGDTLVSDDYRGLNGEELAWFDNAQSHLDLLLAPILETFPIR